jgi:hypothetical protein
MFKTVLLTTMRGLIWGAASGLHHLFVILGAISGSTPGSRSSVVREW